MRALRIRPPSLYVMFRDGGRIRRALDTGPVIKIRKLMMVNDLIRDTKGRGKICLNERDFLIFKFLIEMKFANGEQIFEMFFRSKDSTNPKYCANRLSLLKRSGYLYPHKSYDGNASYYTATKKAHAVLISQGLGDDHLPSPKEEMDYRFFIHDKNLVWLRIYLEKLGLGFNWISERSIRRKLFLELSADERKERNPLADELIPDAIFENKNGEKIFLELEHTIKDSDHYEEKLSRYENIIKYENPTLRGNKVLYVCTKDPITQRLDEVAKWHSFVTVQPLKEFEKEFRIKIQTP